MKESSCRSFKVFDFKEEDELPEIATSKYSGKFRNTSGEDHALKCKYLEFGPGTHTYCMLDQELTNLCSEVEMRTSTPNGSSPEESPSNSPIVESSSNDKSVDLNSDAEENVNEHASTSDIEEGSLNGQESCFPVGSMELVGSNGELLVFPEYVIYKASYYMEPLLTFSEASVKVEVLTALGKERSFILEYSVDDIVDISCQCFNRVEMVLIKLTVISDQTVQDDNMHKSSGFEELKFAVVDPNWFKKQDIIRSMNERYSAIWKIIIATDIGVDEVDISCRKHYFPDFDEPFEELIYPKGDPDAVSISKRDVDLLLPEVFVNDTIIDFYIKYLMNHIHQEDIHRFHFFNSFFFRKLADMDKDPSSASDGRAAFLRVRKWTRRINLFEKDYIFIPVNFNLHWSLIVICHPGEVANFSEEDVTEAAKVPCILHMDSLRGNHTGLKNLVQSYLLEEWKEKGNDAADGISSKFSNLRFVPLELPQQENLSDCGLFLLHYLELFLAEAPPTFNPFKISKFSRYLNADWFLPSEASLKRTLIQKLIYGLLDGQSRSTSADFSGKPQSPEILETRIGNRCIADTLVGTSNTVVPCLSVPEANKGIEIDLLVDPSVRNSQCASNESGLVLRELFDPASSGGPFLGHCQSFNEHYYQLDNDVSAMEDDAELNSQFDYMPYGTCGETAVQEIGRNSNQAGGVPYSTDGCFIQSVHNWKSEISLIGMAENKGESLENSACVAEDSKEIAALKNNNHKPDSITTSENLSTQVHQSLPVDVTGERGKEDFGVPPTFTGSLEPAIIIESSQDPCDGIHDRLGHEHENLGSFHQSSAKLPHRGADLEGSELAQEWESPYVVVDETVEPPIVAAAAGNHRELAESMEIEQSHDPEKVADLLEEPDAKRRRIDPQLLCARGSSESISEELHL
ncbi:hypothetical protein SAY87_000640 [Trapa incisa]|uniref:Ubiquitin-like protease family profile domain-containing protein n=1 Tax=Trapa incisa TaxID=236973 RepID=A0AAN7GJ47_9MYRT|nr:hypothetical protein SAY87_000640 [Trapa incisa]